MADQPAVTYAPTDDLDLIRSTARQFLDDKYDVERVRHLMATDDGFEKSGWKELADLGWTGLSVPEDHGGAGFGSVEMAVLMEEMGRSLLPGPFLASAVLATNLVMAVADEGEQAELLPPMAAGDVIGTAAVFESPRGWDPSDASVAATGDGRLSGTKKYVLDGHIADQLLVTADTTNGIGVFVVDSNADGVEVSQVPSLDPTRRQAEVVLDHVQGRRIGSGDSSAEVQAALGLTSALLANEQVGGAAVAMEMAVEYAKTRHQFGRPIGSYQAIKHRCANMLLKLEHAKSAAYYAVRVADDARELAIAAPLAASVASEAYTWIAGENIQVHGGIGFTWEHDAHLYLKRAKSSSLLLGDPRYQRDLMGTAAGI